MAATATTRAGILAVFAAAIAAIGATVALSETRRANLAAHESEREAQVAERYTRAIDQLGAAGEEKVDVRLGGIYALQRIAQDSDRDLPTVVDVLCAFVRIHGCGPGDEALEEHWPAQDVQAALKVVGRMPTSDLEPPVDLTAAHLERANLMDAGLRRAELHDANLRSAKLQRADLQRACLRRTILQGAQISGADLQHAELHDADLRWATLIRADLRWATLIGANLIGVDLSGADLRYADLRGANLSGALNVSQEQVNRT